MSRPVERKDADSRHVAPRPPSERGREPEERRGIGVFRFAGCGWRVTIFVAALVGVIVLIGYLRGDPERNPAPAGYADAVCAAFGELSAGTDALERGVEGPAHRGARETAAHDVEQHIAAANRAITDLPRWDPGAPLEELLGSQIITLTNAAADLPDGGAGADLDIARDVDATATEHLASGRYGFDCPTSST